ncbi:hypothetical protein DFP72DRAFT_1085190 [Ephemerocybe angulata]|uniref:SET domain-containing protein n=1 Tax=Ephemerocybe angulata TaxID=980116 RepID=A0A8H6H7R5_9AGAR|nr:hypothetical protein DFP72DRAFT_1085190 [Tulosesus angulatus]
MASSDCIPMEDLVVLSLFAPADPTRSGAHVPQTLGLAVDFSGPSLIAVRDAFEDHKSDMDISRAGSYLAAIKKVRSALVRRPQDGPGPDRGCRGLSRERLDCLEWCLSAYGVVVARDSAVRLGVARMGASSEKGFGIFARDAIPAGTTIWDAIGVMPGDNRASHSDLSAIRVAAGQNQSTGAERVLLGPLRMLNHRCRSFNAVFVYEEGTSAFFAQTTASVGAGEEVVVNYGSDWFGETCPCSDCSTAPGASPLLPSAARSAPATMRPAWNALDERRVSLTVRTQEKAADFLENRRLGYENSAGERAEKKRRKRMEGRKRKQASKTGTSKLT